MLLPGDSMVLLPHMRTHHTTKITVATIANKLLHYTASELHTHTHLKPDSINSEPCLSLERAKDKEGVLDNSARDLTATTQRHSLLRHSHWNSTRSTEGPPFEPEL